jgi:hypothetical protein
MKKNNPNKLLIILGILNLCAVGLWFFMYTYSAGVNSQILESSIALAGEESKGTYVTGISGDLRSTEVDRKSIEQTFIKIGDEAHFLENIERLATSTKVEMKVFAFEKRDETLHLSMQIKGTFSRNYLFLSLIENLPYELRINKITIERLQDAGGNIWETHYDLSVISYLEK